MTYLINASNLNVGGGIQVALSFIDELSRISDGSDAFILVVNAKIFRQLTIENLSSNFEVHTYNKRIDFASIVFGKDTFLDGLCRRKNVSGVFTIFGPSYWKPKVYHLVGYAKPHYIYPDSPYFNTLNIISRFTLKLKRFLHIRDFSLNSSLIVTETDNAKMLLRKRFNLSSEVVTNYFHQIFNKTTFHYKSIDPQEISLICISANYPHKNLNIIPELIDKWNAYYPDVRIKVVLTLDFGEIEPRPEMQFIGKQDVRNLPALYQNADVMFLPTLLECFSAAYCEAMISQTSILTTNLPFAKAICGSAAYYYEPLDLDDCVLTLREIFENQQKRYLKIKSGLARLKDFDDSVARADKYFKLLKNETNYPRP